MKISVLMENTPYAEGFRSEHGLSLYIETGKQHILFDTGQSPDGFAENAARLGIDLRDVDFAVLSHGHYDHSGGLMTFLSINNHAPVYVNRRAFEPHYTEKMRDIGIDPRLKGKAQIIPVEERLMLGESLSLCACNDRSRPYRMDPYGLYAGSGDEMEPDRFLHEQYLTVRENGKTFVFSGCSHKGVLNIVDWLKPDVLVGGFHFMKVDPSGPGRALLDDAAKVLLQYPARYYTCHCTGTEQYAYLKTLMGDRLAYLSSGQTVEL
jgi:7,8-dihydropterin-6-yl-methyl-4-(beta-D-ribofuranosyl)aminobenzene 5'-phosphate synthase